MSGSLVHHRTEFSTFEADISRELHAIHHPQSKGMLCVTTHMCTVINYTIVSYHGYGMEGEQHTKCGDADQDDVSLAADLCSILI